MICWWNGIVRHKLIRTSLFDESALYVPGFAIRPCVLVRTFDLYEVHGNGK